MFNNKTKIDHKNIWFNSLSGMATGFFASLIVAFMFSIIGVYSKDNVFIQMRTLITYLTPAFIGLTIGWKAKLSLHQTIAITIASQIVAHSNVIPNFTKIDTESIKEVNGIIEYNTISYWDALTSIKGFSIQSKIVQGSGDVFAALLVSVIALYIFKLFPINTTFDFMIFPVFGILLGLSSMFFLTYITQTIIGGIGAMLSPIGNASTWVKIITAPIIAIIMGVLLSMPVSSAALALMLNMSGPVAAAALAGTSAQMISFAITTYIANGSKSETLAVGAGTSMFQLNNFIKKPKLFIIPIISSGIAGIIAALAAKDILEPIKYSLANGTTIENIKDAISSGTSFMTLESLGSIKKVSGAMNPGDPLAGMGFAALYGPIYTIYYSITVGPAWQYIIHLLIAQLLIPIIITIPLTIMAFKKKWLTSEDYYIWATQKDMQQSISKRLLK